jgi:hypothetical protein
MNVKKLIKYFGLDKVKTIVLKNSSIIYVNELDTKKELEFDELSNFIIIKENHKKSEFMALGLDEI